jgi:hypothetical protein
MYLATICVSVTGLLQASLSSVFLKSKLDIMINFVRWIIVGVTVFLMEHNFGHAAWFVSGPLSLIALVGTSFDIIHLINLRSWRKSKVNSIRPAPQIEVKSQ